MIFTSFLELLNANLFNKEKQVFCLDVGTKKTGFAYSVGFRQVIQGFVVKEENLNKLFEFTFKQMEEKGCGLLVLGFPFGYEQSPSAEHILNFALICAKHNIPVLLYEEANTSLKVKNVIYENAKKMTKKQKQNYDAAVASYILQGAMGEIQSFLKIC